MPCIKWTDEFSVDHGPIDDQHRQLVEIANKFEEASRRGKGSRIMSEILNDLMGYTQEHFAFEEKVLSEAGYPQLERHRSQHRQLIQKLEKFQHEFESQGRRVSAEMKEFMEYWLTSHILKEDKAYVPYLMGEKV